MSNIGGVSNAGYASAPSNIGGGELTLDALMLHCASQLNGLDAAIQAQMAKQNAARHQQEKLGQLTANLAGATGSHEAQRKHDILHAFKAAHDSFPPGHPARAEVTKAYDAFIKSACFNDNPNAVAETQGKYNLDTLDGAKVGELVAMKTDDKDRNDVSLEEAKIFSGNLATVTQDIGKGAELDMINLQSMVSKRQMAVQITTQLISKMNESMMVVIQQVGK